MDEAEAAYRRAIKIDPDHAHAHNNLGVLLAKDPKRLNEAEAAYRRAIKIDPKHAVARINLENLLGKLGRDNRD